jgi:hypothetical protein
MPAANNALPKVGAGRCYFSYNSISALVWGLTLSKILFINFIIIFLKSITARQTIFKTPTVGNAKRWQKFIMTEFLTKFTTYRKLIFV